MLVITFCNKVVVVYFSCMINLVWILIAQYSVIVIHCCTFGGINYNIFSLNCFIWGIHIRVGREKHSPKYLSFSPFQIAVPVTFKCVLPIFYCKQRLMALSCVAFWFSLELNPFCHIMRIIARHLSFVGSCSGSYLNFIQLIRISFCPFDIDYCCQNKTLFYGKAIVWNEIFLVPLIPPININADLLSPSKTVKVQYISRWNINILRL